MEPLYSFLDLLHCHLMSRWGLYIQVKPYIFKTISLCMCIELWQLHM